MIVEVPFNYTVQGIEPRKRTSIHRTGYDTVSVNIRDVPEEDAAVALVLYDGEGLHSETFRFFEGTFWIRNSREDDIEFGPQHTMLMAEYPRKACLGGTYGQRARNPYYERDAHADNMRMRAGLSRFGFLAAITANDGRITSLVDKDHEPKSGFRDGPHGIVCDPYDPSHGFRLVEYSKHRERMEATSAYAHANVIAIAGKLWHRVPEPQLYATDKKIGWLFSGTLHGELRKYSSYEYGADRLDTSTQDAYRVPVTELDSLIDNFPEVVAKNGLDVHIEEIDEACFHKPDLRPLIVKDIKTGLGMAYRLSEHTTPVIHEWCRLRDMAKGLKAEEQDDDFLDAAADILNTIDRLIGKESFPGARMWANRSVALFDADDLDPSRTPAPRG